MAQGLRGEPALMALAGLQRWVVARFQLLQLGITDGAIKHRVKRWRLFPVHRGVYLVGNPEFLPLARETAALLACGPHAVLSHWSAAGMWWELEERDVHVTIARGPRRSKGAIRVHESPLGPADLKVRHRLPLTSPERTLIDLACGRSPDWLEWAVEDGRRRGLLTRASLRRAVDRGGRRSGVRAVRSVLEIEGGPAFTRSEAEVRLTRLLRKAGLTPAEQNARVAGHEVDFFWRNHGLVVEVDGYAFHRGRSAFERDRKRDADLQARGYRVLRITWRQLVEEPERVVALVASGLLPLRGPGAGRGLAALPR